MIRTVIADDHDLIRDGYKKLLSTEGDITLTGEARSAKELEELLDTCVFDVLILDLSLPDRDGMEVLKDLHQKNSTIKTLVLSMHPENRYAKRAIRNGAAGYLTKDSASEELIKAIRRIYTHGKYISPALAEELASDFAQARTVRPHEKLSDREYQVLLLIGAGKKISEAAETLHLSINTVNSYRRRMLEKTGLQSTNDCIRYVLENNLTD